jgi:Helix-turn-helix
VSAAAAIGTSKQAISHWFAGRQGPSPDQCFAIVEFLKKERRQEKRRDAGAAEMEFRNE